MHCPQITNWGLASLGIIYLNKYKSFLYIVQIPRKLVNTLAIYISLTPPTFDFKP